MWQCLIPAVATDACIHLEVIELRKSILHDSSEIVVFIAASESVN